MPGSLVRRAALFVAAVTIGCVAAVMVGEFALVVYDRHLRSGEMMDPGLVVYDERLGWRLARGWQGTHSRREFSARYTVDGLGMRAGRTPRGASTRVAVLGDSFTFGLGVEDDQTFVARLNARQRDRAYYNAAVPGYSPDQAVLWMAEVNRLIQPDEILLVLYLGNDLLDIGEPVALQAPYAKPLAKLDDTGSVGFFNIPVPRTLPARDPGSADLYAGQSEALVASFRLARLLTSVGALGLPADERFAARYQPRLDLLEALLEWGLRGIEANMTVALLPGMSMIERPGSVPGRYQVLLMDALQQRLEARGYAVRRLDIEPDRAAYYPVDGHLTSSGHQQVADLLIKPT